MLKPRKNAKKPPLIRYAGYDPYEHRFDGPHPDINVARAIELKALNPAWGWREVGIALAQENEDKTPYKADAVAGAVFRYKKNNTKDDSENKSDEKETQESRL